MNFPTSLARREILGRVPSTTIMNFPTSLARREILGRVPSTTILETTEYTVFRVLAPAIQT